jgi:hypothetical protein
MKLLIFPAVAALWLLLGSQGCSDGGMMAADYSCAPLNPEHMSVKPEDERNTAMIDNISQVAGGASARTEAAAVKKLETATFSLG